MAGEVVIPNDFTDFTGYDDKASTTVNTTPFSIKFGSSMDQAATKLSEQSKIYNKEKH